MGQEFRFDFAVSYAGEEVGLARDLYGLLEQQGAVVFLAKNEQVYLLGKPLRSELPWLFGAHTKFVVPIVSKYYAAKYWTRFELAIASVEQQHRDFEFILPVKVDDVDIDGLADDVVYLDLRREGVFRTAEVLTAKLREAYPVPEPKVPQHWVATFGVIPCQLAASGTLPSGAPNRYPDLCDWLEADLMRRLSNAGLGQLTFLEDLRTGEGLSVRVGFHWDPRAEPLDLGDDGWWEMLEVVDFESLYGTNECAKARAGLEGDRP